MWPEVGRIFLPQFKCFGEKPEWVFVAVNDLGEFFENFVSAEF